MKSEIKEINFNNPQNGVALLSADYSLLWCSDSVKEIFGNPEGEIEEICIEYLGPSSALPALKKEGVIFEGEIILGELVLGSTFYLSPGMDGSPGNITAVFINTSEIAGFKRRYEKFMSNYILSLETAKIVPWEYDVQRRIVRNIMGISMVFEGDMLELPLDEWESMIHPDDLDSVRRGIEGLLSTVSDEMRIDYRIITGPESIMWLKSVGRITERNQKGDVLIVSGINQNITEIKLLEEKNIQEEEEHREIRSSLKNALKMGRMSPWEYDFSTGKFRTDRQMAEIWGYVEFFESRTGIGWDLLSKKIYPDDIDFVNREIVSAISNNEAFNASFRIVVKGDIKHIHFESEVHTNSEGKPLKLVGVAQDITGIKELEDSLARQFDRLRFIAEKIGLGIWELKTGTGNISVMNLGDNSNADEFRYFTVDELTGMIHPDDLPLFRKRMERHFEGIESVIELEVRIKRRDIPDQYNWYYISSVIGKTGSDGRASEIRGFYQNITDRKEMESKLYQSQKMEAIGRLAGGIAHDFNNILQVILGYGSLALMETDNDTELFQVISNIVDSGDKARTLIRQLLLFARQDKFNPSRASVNSIFTGLLSMLRRLIGENITLTFTPDDELMDIHCDPGQIEQVFLNLCLNSRDAIDGAGSIIINTRNVVIEDYWPSFDDPVPPGNYVMISVSDTGCGIEQEYISRVFEPFFSTKEKNSGTGLGLATVYSIVKQHKGYIDLYTIPGKGTTFTIYLPPEVTQESDKDEESLSDEDVKVEPRMLGGETIILAEDDELVRKYTARILSDSGYRVITATNGEAALELFNDNREDVSLLILDVVMPKINGWDLYNMIGGRDSGVPVIFFSGYDRNLLPEDMNSMPDIRFVQKPFKYYSIIKAVHELLD